MAEALTGVLVQHFATVLIQKIEEHVKLATDAKDEVQKLQKTFKALQKVLKDAEKREFKDEGVKDWLDQFRDVAYDMEDDVLDEWIMEIQRTNIEGPPDENDGRYKLMKEVSSYSCLPLSNCVNKASLCYDIGSRIKVIRKKLDSICADQKQFEFTKSSQNTSSNDTDDNSRHTTCLDIDVSVIQGRDLEKKIISDRLLGESSSSTSNPIDNQTYGPHNIISIIGMGGLGKTTLTQLIIHDGKVKNHFGKNIFWVCVSEPFDRERIAKAIIHEAKGAPPDSPEWNALRVKLCDSVKGKRFLLVLDDLWTDDEDDLYPLKDLVRRGSPGRQPNYSHHSK